MDSFTNIYTFKYWICNFYPTSVPNYTLKPVDLDFNANYPSKKRSYCKGVGKTPKKSIVDHFRCKLKKFKNNLKRKTQYYENSKSF